MSLRVGGIIIAAFFTIFIAYAIRYGYGILVPGMMESLRLSKTEAGLISSAYFTSYTLFSPLVGWLSDQSDSRLLLTLFTAILGLGTLLMGQVDNLLGASLAFALVGLGHAACWSPLVSLVQRWVADGRRGLALAVATSGSTVGIACWSYFLPRLMETGSYRLGWFWLGGSALLVAALNFILIASPPATDPQERKGQQTGGGSTLPALLRSSLLWRVGSAYLLVGFALLIPFTFLGVHAREELALGGNEAATFFTVLALAGFIGKIGLGIMSDRWGRVMIMTGCGVFIAFGSAVLASAAQVPVIYLGTVLIGLGFGAVWPVYAAAAVDFFPVRQAGTVIGIWTVFLGCGSLAAPVVGGWLIDHSGSCRQAFWLAAMTALASALLIMGAGGYGQRKRSCYVF